MTLPTAKAGGILASKRTARLIRLIAPTIFLGSFALNLVFGSGVNWTDWFLGVASVVAVYEIGKAIRP